MGAPAFGIDVVSAGLGFLAGAGLGALGLVWVLLRLTREKAVLEARIQEGGEENRRKMQETLESIQSSFVGLAAEKMKSAQKDSAHDLEKRQIAIADMVKPLQKHLETLGSAVEQMKGTDNALREDLKHLSRETAKLAGALRDPTAQGRWGEYILEGVMEHSGLIKGVHFLTQETMTGTGQRPDMIINLSDTLKIVVDSKTPLNELATALDEPQSEEELSALMVRLAATVRGHINALSKKGYWENLDSGGVDFTVLFLPSEQLFSLALRGDPALADLAASKNIIIASPTLMMGLARVVRMGWRQVDLAENARAISEQGSQLYQRLITFSDHLAKIGNGLSGAMEHYNKAVGSLDRMVFPAARKLQELGVQDGGKSVPAVKTIDDTPRRLTGTEKI